MCSYVANEYSGVVHIDLSECVGKMQEDNQEFYEELYHALSDGYRECGLCLGFFGSDEFEELKERSYQDKRLHFSECLVCGEKRGVQKAHIVPRSRGGSDLMPLCPNHHWGYDHWLLSFDELSKVLHWIKRNHSESFSKKIIERYLIEKVEKLSGKNEWDFGLSKEAQS